MLPFIIGGAVLLGALALFSGNGKKIAIAGGRGNGKTTLFDYLSNQSVSGQRTPTQSKNQVAQKTIKINDVSVDLSRCYDVGGSEASYQQWVEEIKKADFLFYLFNIKKIIDVDFDYQNQMRKELSYISKVVRDKKAENQEFKIILVGTHADKVSLSRNDFHAFEKMVWAKPILKEAIIALGGKGQCQIVLGSLASNNSAKMLVDSIFKSMK